MRLHDNPVHVQTLSSATGILQPTMSFSQHYPVLFGLLLAFVLTIGQVSGNGQEWVQDPTCTTECPSIVSNATVDAPVAKTGTLTAGIGLLPQVGHVPMDLILLMLAGIGYGVWRLRSAGGSTKPPRLETRTTPNARNANTGVLHLPPGDPSGILARTIALLRERMDSDDGNGGV